MSSNLDLLSQQYTNIWLQVSNETCDHLVDALIKTMKYLNDSHGCEL